MLVFVDVMKELPATLVLRPFNTDTLAIVTHQLVRLQRLGVFAINNIAVWEINTPARVYLYSSFSQ